jgi:hypothetical protein
MSAAMDQSRDRSSAPERERWGAVVAGVFPDGDSAERGVRALQSAGFSRDVIGIAMRTGDPEGERASEGDSKAPQGAAAGAVSGGILGGVVGSLVGGGALVT